MIPDYGNISKEVSLYRTILNRGDLPIHPTNYPNLSIVPSHIMLSNTDIELTTAKDHREARLKNALDKVKEEYDHILIDCPPALSWLTINAFTASDQVLVVISPGMTPEGGLGVTLRVTWQVFFGKLHSINPMIYQEARKSPFNQSRTGKLSKIAICPFCRKQGKSLAA